MRWHTLASATLCAGLVACNRTVPRFEDYPAHINLGVDPPQAVDPIENAGQGAANFAGMYRINLISCGRDCTALTIVDRATGNALEAVTFYRAKPDHPQSAEFRHDSRLLIIHGCPGERDCGVHYYVMETMGLREIRRVLLDQRR